METTPDNTAVEWHPETVTAATTDALRSLRDQGLLTGSYLAGDTGLALRFGQYSATRYSRLQILKSFTFFSDAEKDPMPNMLLPIAWDEVKAFFVQEAPSLLQ